MVYLFGGLTFLTSSRVQQQHSILLSWVQGRAVYLFKKREEGYEGESIKKRSEKEESKSLL